jgi:hypothetical protein
MMKVSLNQFMKHHCLQTKNKRWMTSWLTSLDLTELMICLATHMMKEPMQMIHVVNILPRDNGSGKRQRQEAEAHARTPIFQGARLSHLLAILGLLNIQAKHKASNTILWDIFQYCHSLLLPKENVLLGSWKEAKKLLSSIGMEYQIVHACVNDYVISWEQCPFNKVQYMWRGSIWSSHAYREGAQEISKMVSHYSSFAAHVSMYRLG